MTVASGARLDPYEVMSQVGAGGPPPLALRFARELWRDLDEARQRPR